MPQRYSDYSIKLSSDKSGYKLALSDYSRKRLPHAPEVSYLKRNLVTDTHTHTHLESTGINSHGGVKTRGRIPTILRRIYPLHWKLPLNIFKNVCSSTFIPAVSSP